MAGVQRVIFFGAHPDDETVMTGGTLAMLAAQGVMTAVVCATDGRGGEAGDVVEARRPEDRVRIRAEELRCACEALGVKHLTRLNYVDPVIGPNDELFEFDADDDTLVRQIAAYIAEQGADVVLSHGADGEYGHPAHKQMHRAVSRAVREHAPHVLFYSVAAALPDGEDRLWNAHEPAHVALPIAPWIEQKHAAMLCHRTQHVLFLRRRKLKAVRDAIRTVETFHRQWPLLDTPVGAPDDAFVRVLLAAGGWRPAF